jgi:DNA-binding PadR family transcriptional regulator
MGRAFLGEFEQRVLLAVLRCGDKPFPIEIRQEVARTSGHTPSRGALYTTLDRLEAKGLLRWTPESGEAGRDALPRRRFRVTAKGLRALKVSRRGLFAMWAGLDEILGES